MNYFNGTHLTFGTFCWISVTQSKLFFLVRCRRTISMETGCQNIQLAHAILKLGFPPGVIGNLSIFPFVYILFQLIEAGVLILVSRCYQRYKTKHKGKRNLIVSLKITNIHTPQAFTSSEGRLLTKCAVTTTFSFANSCSGGAVPANRRLHWGWSG